MKVWIFLSLALAVLLLQSGPFPLPLCRTRRTSRAFLLTLLSPFFLLCRLCLSALDSAPAAADSASLLIEFSGAPQKRDEVPTNRDPAVLLRILIATFMGIDQDEVIVLRMTQKEGSVVICEGNVVNFVETVNNNNDVFQDTLLEGATIPLQSIIFDVPCSDFISTVAAPLTEDPQYVTPAFFLPSSFRNDQVNNDEDGPGASSAPVLNANFLFSFLSLLFVPFLAFHVF